MSSRKRHSITLDEKLKILKFVDEHPTTKRITLARQLDIPVTTLFTIMANRQSIEANIDHFDPSCRSTKSGRYKELDGYMVSWLKEITAEPGRSRPTLEEMREMASDVADSMGIDGFKASNGWLCRFNKRHGFLRPKRKQPSEQPGKDTAAEACRTANDFVAFLQVREQYHPRDVYVIGWTQLYHTFMPPDLVERRAADLSRDSDVRHAARHGEPRVAVLLGVNEDCTDRLTPWVIGRQERPASLQGLRSPPCNYVGGSEAPQLTTDVLGRYLLSLNERMGTEKRSVAVFLARGVAAKVRKALTNVQVYDLVQEASQVQNPLEMGVLARFKELYRTYLFRRLALMNGQLEEARPTMLIATSLAVTAWDSVEQKTVRAAFRACGFRGCISAHRSADSQETDPVGDGGAVDAADVPSNSYAQADMDMVCDRALEEDCKPGESHVDATSNGNDERMQQRAVTQCDVLRALDTLRLHVCSQGYSQNALNAFYTLEKAFYNS